MKQGQLVEVYFNLHKNVFSIRDVKTKRVIGHSAYIRMEKCEFKVSEAGRQRVLREKRKNVHSVIRGKLVGLTSMETTGMKEAYYNPYIVETFVDRHSKEKLKKVDFAYCENKKVWYT